MNTDTRVQMAADTLPFRAVEGGIEQLPCTLQAEPPEVIKHRLPGWEVGRQIAPGAAGAQDIEDGVEDAAQRVGPRSASCRQGREKELDAGPLCVREGAGIHRTHTEKRMTSVTYRHCKTPSHTTV